MTGGIPIRRQVGYIGPALLNQLHRRLIHLPKIVGGIDMASPNINMRDPVIYRVAHMSHHNTGDTWCIYPMYDFAHPIYRGA